MRAPIVKPVTPVLTVTWYQAGCCLSPDLSQDVNLTLCDVKCFFFLLVTLQGSLYELDKVSFIHTCECRMLKLYKDGRKTKFFCISLSNLIIYIFFI